MSYIHSPGNTVQVSFIALDSENLGDHVDDSFHTDFGNNMFPYFYGNKTKSINSNNYEYEDNNDDHVDVVIQELTESEITTLGQYIPNSLISFLYDY